MKLIQLSLVLAICLLNQSAQAAIIGMLHEDSNTKVRVLSLPNEMHDSATVEIVSPYRLDKIYFSRFLGGEGGDALAVLQAMMEGRTPPHQEIQEWMEADTAENRSAKIGIFTPESDSKFNFQSALTGQQTSIPRVESQAKVVRQLPNGSYRQLFDFPVSQTLSSQQMIEISDGKMDVSLVTQHSSANNFDSSLKRTAELPVKAAFRRYMCRKVGFFQN
jgi:hypothetical protein